LIAPGKLDTLEDGQIAYSPAATATRLTQVFTMEHVALSPAGDRSREALTVSVGEALRLVGIGRTRFYELVASGQVTTVKLGRRRLVHMASLKLLVSGLPEPVPQSSPSQLPLFGGGEEVKEGVSRRRKRRQ